MKASIVIGANYGDEGKGTVVARLARDSKNVLNVLTNGGSQRGHSILTQDGSMTFQHFGAGTYFGADNYYGREYILNPMQFVSEYNALVVKPKHIYRDSLCRWSTPYDIMANLIDEEQRGRKASCGMGIWFTIRRFKKMPVMMFDQFMLLTPHAKEAYLDSVQLYYERQMTIPHEWRDVWLSDGMRQHFLNDCETMDSMTIEAPLSALTNYDHLIFENGQGLLLSDTGKDTYDTTPSDTGINYAIRMVTEKAIDDLTVHYVSRPYLTRHGDGEIMDADERKNISSSIQDDRTNRHNDNQGSFRYGHLDIPLLRKRILNDTQGQYFILDVTHCDEMDRENEFKKEFKNVNFIDTALVTK